MVKKLSPGPLKNMESLDFVSKITNPVLVSFHTNTQSGKEPKTSPAVMMEITIWSLCKTRQGSQTILLKILKIKTPKECKSC
jgi:hypothetical protein